MATNFLLGPRSESITRRNAAELVAEVLAARIFTGDLVAGSSLREEALAASLDVSRNTLREAIRILVHNGLVSYHMHRGATVTTLSEADISDIFLNRRMFELAAIRAPAGEGWKDEMELVLQRYRRAVEDQDRPRVIECDLLFHRTLVSRLGSERIARFFERTLIELRLGLVLRTLDRDLLSQLLAQHRRILDLLISGSLEECEQVLRAHLADSEAQVRSVVGGSA